MADNVVITAGTGTTVAADEVVDGTLGTVKAQYIKLMDGTLDGTAKAKIGTGTPVAGEAGLWVKLSPDGLNANGQTTMANSAPTVIASDQTTISVAADTAKIANGASGTYLTPKFQKITASSSGATTIVAAVTSKKIRVLAWDTVANAAVNFKWQSHVTPTDLTGLYYMSGQGNGVARAFCPIGLFETVSGEALDINLSGAVAVGGVLTYVEV